MIKSESLKKEKKELLIFLAVTFGLTFLMGIPMAILFYAGKDLSFLAYAQMHYPAAGLMLAKLICEKDNPLLPQKFFTGFLVLTGVMVLWCFSDFFLPDNIRLIGISILIPIGIIIIGILYFSEKQEHRSAYGLISKNWNLSIRILAMFVALFFAGDLLATIATEGLDGLDTSLSADFFRHVWMLPVSFVLSFDSFLGEEYGWRCYFQPLLQQKFGLIKGVLLFGVLWEFWHLPLVLFFYAPMDPTISLLQLIVFRYSMSIIMAIFMAYAYMRTHNVWLPVLIHFANNSLASFASETGMGETTWTMVGITILIQAVLFLPFLFSNVFRKQSAS